MVAISKFAAMIEKNEVTYRQIAELSRAVDLQFAGVAAELGRQVAAMTDISKLVDPAIFSVGKLVDPAIFSVWKLVDPAVFSVGAQVQALVDSMKMPTANLAALTSVSDLPKHFEGYRFAIDSQLSSIFQDLGGGALARRRTYPFATAAAAAAGSVEDLMPEDFVAEIVSGERTEPDDDAQRVPLVLTRFQVVMIAYGLALAIWFLTLGDDGVSREQLQRSLNAFSVGVLGSLTVWLLIQPPNDN